jgi:hypothetical protein
MKNEGDRLVIFNESKEVCVFERERREKESECVREKDREL